MTVRLQDRDFTLYHGDALQILQELPDSSVDCVITSPPYENTRPDSEAVPEYEWPAIFNHLARIVTGPMLWNVGRIWRDGQERLWWTGLIRDAGFSGWQHWDTAVWVKPNANPIRGRVFADSHEYVLVFGRDGVRLNEDAIRTEYAASSIPRLKRRWINGRGVKGDDRETQQGRRVNETGARARSFFVSYVGREKGNKHPTPMPLDLAEDLVHLASWPGGVVLDPFLGSGTTALAARKHGRHTVGIELSAEYCDLIATRLQQLSLLA